VAISPGAVVIHMPAPLTTGVPTITPLAPTLVPTFEPTPTQEIDWEPTAPVLREAVNVTGDNWNVRDCDDSSCPVVGRLGPGQRVEYVTSRGRWLEILWNGSTAYVWDECCTVD